MLLGAHLGAQAVAEAVGEAGGGVVVHARRVHPPQELLRRRPVVCSAATTQQPELHPIVCIEVISLRKHEDSTQQGVYPIYHAVPEVQVAMARASGIRVRFCLDRLSSEPCSLQVYNRNIAGHL